MRRIVASSILALTAALATAATAQTAGQVPAEGVTPTPAPTTAGASVEEIVVTGSSIRGVASAGSPTVGVGIEEIRQAGVATATDAIRLLPQVLNLGADESRSSFNGGAQDGAANSTAINGVNLRGVGPESTLLLVNGRRIAPGGVIKALYDLNVVAANAISRLEVVTDGASAIYGADAVAGVVNIITRRRTDEIESFARYGFGDDIDQKVFGQTLGFNWGSGGVFGAYEHNERSNLAGRDRKWATQDRRARGGSDARQTLASPGNILVGTTRYGLPAGNGVGVAPGRVTAGTVNLYDEGFDADLLPSQNRESFFGNLYQDVTPDLTLWAEGFYTTRTFTVDQPAASGTLTVPASNAFFVLPAGITATSARVEYRFAQENPAKASYGKEEAWHAATGFDWDVGAGFRLSGFGDISVSDGFQSRNNILNNAALTQALASSNPATAFNPFGDGSYNVANNPALVDRIVANRDTSARSTNKDLSLKLDGPLFDLPAGAVRIAGGVEYHHNRFEQTLVATNVLASGAATIKSVDNRRNFKSVYGEVFVPVVGSGNAMPGIERLELSVAARYDDYSDFGTTTNPKVGLIYAPVRGLVLRGTYGTSFRAPSLVDTSPQIQNIFIQNLTDPASATGVTRGVFINGGNPDLQPEEATTWSGGVDIKPEALPGASLSVNYYRISYKNRIDVVPANALTNNAYTSFVQRRPGDATAAAAFNARLAALLASPDLQSPAEPVTTLNAFIDGRRQNLGSLRQEGIDANLAYAFDSGIGRWRLGADLSFITKLTRATAPGSASIDVLDTFGNPVNFRGRGSVIWSSGGFAFASFVNYVDSYTNTAIAPNVRAKSYTTVDANLSYDLEKGGASGLLAGTRIALSIQNAFDRDPPVVLNGTLSYDSQNINPIGRFFALEVTKKW